MVNTISAAPIRNQFRAVYQVPYARLESPTAATSLNFLLNDPSLVPILPTMRDYSMPSHVNLSVLGVAFKHLQGVFLGEANFEV